MNQQQLEQIMAEVNEQTKQPAVSIEIDPDRVPSIFDSKFGGVPYWDMEKEYPEDENGDKLMLLAQFNLEQKQLGELLPKTGMLQFFIGMDDMMGMDMDKQDKQDGFRVVYHELIHTSVTKEDVLKLEIPYSTSEEEEEFFPVMGEYAVDLTETMISMGIEEDPYGSLFYEAAKKLNIEVGEEEDIEDLCCEVYGEDEFYDTIFDDLQNSGHSLLGFPYFTQSDPREDEKRYRRYDTLLFQMDSDYDDDNEYVMWGDAGVANFFINKEDLKRRDFSKILYNWDCC